MVISRYRLTEVEVKVLVVELIVMRSVVLMTESEMATLSATPETEVEPEEAFSSTVDVKLV